MCPSSMQGLFNQVFHPLSITLNNEMSLSGAEVNNLLERVYEFGCGLPGAWWCVVCLPMFKMLKL